MFRAQSILVPVDFSDAADAVVTTAVELAGRFDGRVCLLHAYEIPALGFPDGVLVASSDIASRISSAAQANLEALANKFRSRAPIEIRLKTGPAWECINETAKEIGADLIVIGTHGRRGLARALLGSVAENVIRTSTLPVLVIHGPRPEDAKDQK